jgi:hypothetical protein
LFPREYLIVTYRTDPHKLREVVPEVREPVVKFEFVRIPDSTSFRDYTESGQVIPVSLRALRPGGACGSGGARIAPIAFRPCGRVAPCMSRRARPCTMILETKFQLEAMVHHSKYAGRTSATSHSRPMPRVLPTI